MKNSFILLLLAFSISCYSQIIHFPDPNFKHALVNTKCVDLDGNGQGERTADFNKDGEIDLAEALSIPRLYLGISNMTSHEGLQYFTNLIALRLSSPSAKLLTLDVSSLKILEELGVPNLSLTQIILPDDGRIKILSVYNNDLETIDISQQTNLNSFLCYGNKLKTLNLNGLNNLNWVDCKTNQLKTISVVGCDSLKTLKCSNNNLDSLQIFNLPSLRYLECSSNKIKNLDFKSSNYVSEIYCENNGLNRIILPNNSNLKKLVFNSNFISSIDISLQKKLEELEAWDNKIDSLDFEPCKKIKKITTSNNKLKYLNIKNIDQLELVSVGDNDLSNIETSGSNNIKHLHCFNNKIEHMDINNLSKLDNFNCSSNELKSLFLKNGREISFLEFKNNPDIKYICCDNQQFGRISQKAKQNGLVNFEINSYCSFAPGGNFYIFSGETNFYQTQCGSQKLNTVPFTRFTISNWSVSGDFISNFRGLFSIPIQAGTHTITPILEHPDHFEVKPSSFTISFPSTSDTITQNFCITPKSTIFRQTNITVIPLTPPARPGFDASYKIVWENVGNQVESGTLNFTYDERLLDYVSATQTADQIADGIIKWNFNNLLPFEKREITVTLKVNRPTDIPAVNAGDKLYLTASIFDNIFTLENTVVGSYDPNDKTCLQGDRIHPDMIGKYVDFLIRFENTGNYAAENVVVKDIIDTKTFDVSTLQITDASHEVYTRIEGNKVEFIFENIQLPFDDANNDGYIAFRIKTLSSLSVGDSLKNLADIYFDYNFPIRTNETQSKFAFPVSTKDIPTDIRIYPNPVQNVLYIDTNESWTKAEIFDISGRILRSISLYNQSVDVSGLESGTYFMRLKDGEKVRIVKFVKI